MSPVVQFLARNPEHVLTAERSRSILPGRRCSPVRTHTLCAISGVNRASGGWPISGSVLPDAFVRHEAEERRLLELHHESLSQRFVEHRIARGVGELGKHDRVLVGQRRGPAAVDRTGDCRGNDDSGADRQPSDATLREQGPPYRRCVPARRAADCAIALQPLEVRANLAGVLIAKLSILLQALADDARQFRGSAGIQPSHRHRRAIQNAVEDRPRAVTVKRRRAGRHFVQHDAEREQVGAGIHVLRPHLLGRHVRDRSQRTSRTRQVGRAPSRSPRCRHRRQPDGPWPVRNRESSRGRGGDEQIRRLDVAVDDPSGVRCLERVGDLDRQRQQPIDLERAPRDADASASSRRGTP